MKIKNKYGFVLGLAGLICSLVLVGMWLFGSDVTLVPALVTASTCALVCYWSIYGSDA